ncbi:NADH-quinone oxidoreductase subunit C/D [Alloacidobacterium dinghuense]|uniref:NADH-quinone oxidoreductase subunit D n=1 Tax=Alloacidobacterium dinghuense TaxID=2763107 RepID=A0A7G8BLP7_9BACT|nr:NADH-quinone oxidoreductase subunit C/D [Alloacidobacterium dinghuense]QNI33467.1 NADH-quinone oxidoreductase subunit C/D [Alloacidobacterium dinghuense]
MVRSLVADEGLQNELLVPSVPQSARDEIPTFWIAKQDIHEAVRSLRHSVPDPYKLFYDVTAIDERGRTHRDGQPPSDFTAVYHLYSFGRNEYVRLKVALEENDLTLPTITDVFPAANWYEREVWDMFGIKFDGHPHLTRILMPSTWVGHPLRKDHPARATEMGPFTLPPEKEDAEQAALQFHPEEWGMSRQREGSDFIFLNIGPQHPGTHGVLRIILELDGEEIIDCVPEIGFHHRGAEKMGERQTWHTYIPYTDRVDYLGGVMNNLAYLSSVEKLAGITVPPRGQMIRVMMAELFRIMNHLVWYGTFAQDVGQMSPVFFMFNDREKALSIVEAICGARMHPNWFRIGGVAQDLPNGWDGMFRDFLNYMPPRMAEYERTVMRNRLFKVRTKGIGGCTVDEAIEWGMTGPNLRAAGLEWDFRKKQPYSCYDQLEFDIPIANTGDCYDRAIIHIEEIRQSLRIIQQCVDQMPGGPCNADHPLTTPPPKARTMHDIETLINHFLGVSWGPVMPPGEAMVPIEATKGNNGYYLTSDGSTGSYRTRIRTPSFAHMQMLPLLCRGRLIPDLLAIIGSLDYVLADIDR